jgi:inorganic pyrophosphatase
MDTSVKLHATDILESVTPHFHAGVQNFNIVVQLLINTKMWIPGDITETDQMKISKHVQEAYDHFEKADMMLSSHKSDVNEYVFNCMKMEGQLISDIKEAENNIRKESIAINEKYNRIEITKSHLVSARTDLDHAERVANRAYSELRRRRREAESGFFAIPLIGSFAAYFLGLYDAIETAEYFLRKTEVQVNRYLNNIEQTENEIRSLYTKLENIKKEKIVKERELKERREKIEELKMFQKKIFLYSEYLGKWIHFISVTFGKTDILRKESIHLISVDPLVTVIRDIAAYIRKSSEDLSIYTDPHLKFAVEKFLLLSKYVEYQQTVSQYVYVSVVCLLSLYFISKIMPIIFYLNNPINPWWMM